jgi:hypothetical protein
MEVPALYTNKQFSQEFNLTYTGPNHPGRGRRLLHRRQRLQQVRHHPGRRRPHRTFTSGDIDTKAWAVYADGSYNLTDACSCRLGGRYTVDKREADVYRQIYLGLNGSPRWATRTPSCSAPTPTCATACCRAKTRSSPRAWPSTGSDAGPERVRSWSKGFKGGGFDPRLNVVGTRITLGPGKRRLPSGNHRHHRTGPEVLVQRRPYHHQYRGVLQRLQGRADPGLGGDRHQRRRQGRQLRRLTTNAGKAKIKGFEFEAVAHITSHFSLSGMYSYIDAKYNEYIVAGVNVANQREFQNTPKNSANLRANYDCRCRSWATTASLANADRLGLLPRRHQPVRDRLDPRPGRLQAVRRQRGLDPRRRQDPRRPARQEPLGQALQDRRLPVPDAGQRRHADRLLRQPAHGAGHASNTASDSVEKEQPPGASSPARWACPSWNSNDRKSQRVPTTLHQLHQHRRPGAVCARLCRGDGIRRLPVICIHGLTRNSADFDELAPMIASLGRRVLAPDVRGRGHSARDPNPDNYNPVVYADDVVKLMHDLGIARAVFVGTSMGGLITMTLAVRTSN